MPIEKKLQEALESILGTGEGKPSIVLVVSKEHYPIAGGSGIKDRNWKGLGTSALFYAEAHLDPENRADLPSDEAAQLRGWMADLVADGIEALEQVKRRLTTEGAGPLRVREYHYFGPDGRAAW